MLELLELERWEELFRDSVFPGLFKLLQSIKVI